jgi:hypothetical protein
MSEAVFVDRLDRALVPPRGRGTSPLSKQSIRLVPNGVNFRPSGE